jgi:hypothetical protein
MADLLGFTSIVLVSLITLLISLRWPDVSKIILVALTFRILIILVGYYIIPLPDSDQDALGFENLAWTWAQSGFSNTFNRFPGINSFFYPWIVALIYSLFGRSLLMIQSIGLLFGIGSVFLGWMLAKKLWDNRSAMKVGWVLALFPSLALYSIIPLREVYSSFFLLVAMIGIVNWTKDGSYKSIFMAISGFIGATFFHGVLLIGGVVFFFIVFLTYLKEAYKSILNLRINFKSILIVFMIIVFFAFYFSGKIYIPYVGNFEQSIDTTWLIENISKRMKGDATYPEWTKIKTPIDLIYKGILRSFYFLISPFPWDVTKTIHYFGVFDGLLYLILIYLILKNLKVIWRDPALRIILIIIASYIFIFGIGTSNFGAGLRHRTKFVIELIILAAPLIPNFTFSYKKKLRKYIN